MILCIYCNESFITFTKRTYEILSSSASRWFTKIKSLADHFHDNVTHFGRKKKPVLCLPCIQIASVSWPSVHILTILC